MLLAIVVSNLVYLLLPALISARVTTPQDPVNLGAHHVKRLSNPLRNLLHKRDAILFAGTPNGPNGFALNSTNGQVEDTIPFETEIDLPGQGRRIYFFVKGEIDSDYTATVEFWTHYLRDRRIGVYHGDLVQGIDMKIPESIKVINGEARLYVVASGEYDILVFEYYGSVVIPPIPVKTYPRFLVEIKRWKVGNLKSIQDVPNNSGVQTLLNDAGVNTE